MKTFPFDLKKHIYQNDEFAELVKDAIRFFHGSPVCSVPPDERFPGQGVYALYYIGSFTPYQGYRLLNRVSYTSPIYVGKAVPQGWRQSRRGSTVGNELANRIRQHSVNIQSGEHLSSVDFRCRFVVFEGESRSMISTIEAALIEMFSPLWNSVVDGFGNHDPGAGRRNQRKSDWDVIHPGRAWAESLAGIANDRDEILGRISEHMKLLRK
jgi:hypothetical protein